MDGNDTYARALIRNLNEAGIAILERRALEGIENAKSSHSIDFIRLSYDALFNDYIAHAIKLFERSNQAVSFWYLHRCQAGIIDKFIKKENINISLIHKATDSLAHVRNKTHFHLDKKRVFDPSEVWNEANITGKELALAIDDTWKILEHLHFKIHSKYFGLPEYNGEDATKIIKAGQEAGILPSW